MVQYYGHCPIIGDWGAPFDRFSREKCFCNFLMLISAGHNIRHAGRTEERCPDGQRACDQLDQGRVGRIFHQHRRVWLFLGDRGSTDGYRSEPSKSFSDEPLIGNSSLKRGAVLSVDETVGLLADVEANVTEKLYHPLAGFFFDWSCKT